MPKHLNDNQIAEAEANDVAARFMNSNDVMSDMERAYHTSFSNVTIHTDDEADDRVKAAGRDAIASGSDIFFGKGILESNSPASKGLMAHELTHIMQQSGNAQELGLTESVPYGEEEGGLLSWISGWWGRRKQKKAMKNLSSQGENGIYTDNDQEGNGAKPVSPVFTSNKQKIINSASGHYATDQDPDRLMNSMTYALNNKQIPFGDTRTIYDEGDMESAFIRNNQINIDEYLRGADEAGFDYAASTRGLGKTSDNGYGFSNNNRLTTGMTTDFIDILAKNAKSKQGQAYFRLMTNQIKDTALFGENSSVKATPLDFILKDYIHKQSNALKEEAAYNRLPEYAGNLNDEETFSFLSGQTPNRKYMVLRAARNMNEASSMALKQKLTGEKPENLDPNMKKIMNKYEELRNMIQEMLQTP